MTRTNNERGGMSAPDRKAWKKTQAEIDHLWRNDPPWCDEIGELTEAVARRRALEELRALAASYCLLCEMKRPMSTERGSTHESPFMDGGDASCTAWAIHDRIAEIEAEAE